MGDDELGSARAARDYVAQYPNPIEVSAGAIVRVDREDADSPGWWWCVAADGRAGWAPGHLLEPFPAAGKPAPPANPAPPR